MKRLIPILLAALCLTSCLESHSDYTPEIRLSYAVTSDGDTLGYFFDKKAESYRMDTIQMNDTAKFVAGFITFTNNLVSTHVEWDTAHLQVWSMYEKELTSVLLPESDTTTLDLYFPTNYNYVGIPIFLTPKKVGSSAMIFKVVSDSKFTSSEQKIMIDVIQ